MIPCLGTGKFKNILCLLEKKVLSRMSAGSKRTKEPDYRTKL